MKRVAPLLAVSALFLLAAAARLTSIIDTGIYADEGTHFSIARSLMGGQIRYLAVQDSTLLFAKGPIFPAALAAFWSISGTNGIGLDALYLGRYLVALLQLLNIAMLVTVIRRSRVPDGLAWLAGFLLAFSPWGLVLGGYSFSYHFVATLALWVWLSWRESQRSVHHSRRWLILAASAMGMAMLTDLVVWSMLPGLVYLVGRRNSRDWPLVLFIALAPTAAFLILGWTLAPQATRFDLAALWSRITALSLNGQIDLLRENFVSLVNEESWIPVSILGALAIPRQFRTDVLWFFGIPILVVARSVALTGLAAYHLLPWLPWLALLAAALIWYLANVPIRLWKRPIWLKPAVLLLAAGIWLSSGKNDFHARVSLPTADAQAVADFLATIREPDELVLATPALAWMLPGAVADYQMALAAEGLESAHIPGSIPDTRFAYDARFASAGYAVVDDYLFRWGLLRMPDLARQIAAIEMEWQRVYMTETVAVYRRPP